MRPRERQIDVAHALAERTRLRLVGPRLSPEQARALGAALSTRGGVEAVSITPRTGSVLCRHAPTVDAVALLDVARAELERFAREEAASGKSAMPPVEPMSRVARELARVFRELDDELLDATYGKIDLGMLAALGFVGAGAIHVVLDDELPAPPWFNLAWWGFRTFMTLEQDAIAGEGPLAEGS